MATAVDQVSTECLTIAKVLQASPEALAALKALVSGVEVVEGVEENKKKNQNVVEKVEQSGDAVSVAKSLVQGNSSNEGNGDRGVEVINRKPAVDDKCLVYAKALGYSPSTGSKGSNDSVVFGQFDDVSSVEHRSGASIDSRSWADASEEDGCAVVSSNGKDSRAAVDTGSGINGGTFYSRFVRTSNVKNFSAWLKARGVSGPKNNLELLALVTFVPATMPVEFNDGKRRLKALGVVGDKAASLALSSQLYAEGCSNEQITNKVSGILSRARLTPVCVASGMSDFLVFPANVDRNVSSTAGESLEAVFGYVYKTYGINVLEKFMRALQLLK